MKQLEYSSRNSRLLALELDIKAPIFDPMKCTAKVANAAAISKRTKHLHLSYQKIRMQNNTCQRWSRTNIDCKQDSQLIYLFRTNRLPNMPDVIICIPTIKRDIDNNMLIKTAPRKGDAIIMIDKTIDITPATILNILDALLLDLSAIP